MSGLCGWIGATGADTGASETLAAMIAGLVGAARTDNVKAEESGRALAASAKASLSVDDGAVWAAIEGRPQWRQTELVEIAARDGHAAALIAGYRREGRNCLKQLAGNWAAALIDVAGDYGLIAIDRIGVQPMCFARTDAGLVFGTTTDSVRMFAGTDTSIDYQSVYDLLYFTRISAPATIYTGIAKLEPGQAIEVRAGKVEPWRHARLTYEKPARVDEQALVDELRRIVRRAVARCLEGTDPGEVGAFLSGGLDSTTVTGILSEQSPTRPRAFTVGFDAPGYDEMEFAEAAAQHFGVEHHACYVTPADILEFLPRMAAMYDEPFANGSAVPAYYCARQAQQAGIRVMLAGDGGDELFGGNERYVKQRVYEHYWHLPTWLRRFAVDPLAAVLPESAPGPMGKAKRYIRRARIPMPERLESFNHFGAIPGDRVFTAEIARRVDTHGPIGTMQRHYHALDGASMLDRMMFLDMQTTIADDDLRKVNRTAEANGIEVRYPLLDDEVVDFSTRLPESLQLKGGELRWFFKHAMRDILPVSTLTKSKHGFGLPFDLWIRTDSALRDYAYGKLDAMSRRGIFQRELIETTIAAHRRGDLHSHGQLVWALLLLELWFETRHDDVTGAAVRIAATA